MVEVRALVERVEAILPCDETAPRGERVEQRDEDCVEDWVVGNFERSCEGLVGREGKRGVRA